MDRQVGRRAARCRLAHLLCEIAIRQEAAGLSDGAHFVIPFTQEQLGDATGLTAVHVNRTLRALAKEGVIDRNNRSIAIADWERMTEVGDFSSRYLHPFQSNLAPGQVR